jgi:hypothetical protein
MEALVGLPGYRCFKGLDGGVLYEFHNPDAGTELAVALSAYRSFGNFRLYNEQKIFVTPSEDDMIDPLLWLKGKYGRRVMEMGPVTSSFIQNLTAGDVAYMARGDWEQFRATLNHFLYVADIFMSGGTTALLESDAAYGNVDPPKTFKVDEGYAEPDGVQFRETIEEIGGEDLPDELFQSIAESMFGKAIPFLGGDVGSSTGCSSQAGGGADGVLYAEGGVVPGHAGLVDLSVLDLSGSSSTFDPVDEPIGTKMTVGRLFAIRSADAHVVRPDNLVAFPGGDGVKLLDGRLATRSGSRVRVYEALWELLAADAERTSFNRPDGFHDIHPQEVHKGVAQAIAWWRSGSVVSQHYGELDPPNHRGVIFDRFCTSVDAKIAAYVLRAYLGMPTKRYSLGAQWSWFNRPGHVNAALSVRWCGMDLVSCRKYGHCPLAGAALASGKFYWSGPFARLVRLAYACDLAFYRHIYGQAPGPEMETVARLLRGSKHYDSIRCLGYWPCLPRSGSEVTTMGVKIVEAVENLDVRGGERHGSVCSLLFQLPTVVIVNMQSHPVGLKEVEHPSVTELRWAFRIAYCLAHRAIGSPLFVDLDGIGPDVVVRPRAGFSQGYRAVQGSWHRYTSLGTISGFRQEDRRCIREFATWVDSAPTTYYPVGEVVDLSCGSAPIGAPPAAVPYQTLYRRRRDGRPMGLEPTPLYGANLNSDGTIRDRAIWRMN